MPATALTARTVVPAGHTETAKAACNEVDGNSYTNGPKVWAEFTSSAGGTVTFVTPGTVGGNAIADLVVTFTGAQSKRIGPLSPSIYGDTVTFTASVATITVAVYQLGSAG